MRRHTVSEVADKLGVHNEAARGLMSLLLEKKIVEKVGVKPLTQGRSAAVYEFPDGYEDRIAKLLRAAKLTS